MKKRIGLVLLIVLLTMLVIYLGISYAVYDKLSRVTAGGDDNARNTPATFFMTYAKWPSFNVTVWMPEGIRHVAAEFDLSREYESRLVAFFNQSLSH